MRQRLFSPHRALSSIAFLTAILVGAVAVAEPSTFEKITEVEGITEYRMANGLKVLLFPDPTAATVTVNVTYRVGSRHEGRGEKGMAHLLEHMVFKGTAKRDNIWGELQDHGAQFNGTTSADRTNYYETLPASEENLDFALEMEADRMVNSLISAEELAKEMTVVRNEFEMGENSPDRVLRQRIMSTAYLWHNYGFSTIGNRSDLERVPAESLRRFYENYYQPDNATLVVAGKFDYDRTLEKVEEYFGAIPSPERVLEATYTEEPAQDGARSVVLRRSGGVAAAGLAYHIPAGSDPGTVALDVLADVLTQRPSGRLYKALVDGGRAARVSAFAFTRHDPSLFLVNASLGGDQAEGDDPGSTDPEAVLAEMIELVEKVAGTVTDEEVERSKAEQLKQIKLAFTDSRRIGLILSEGEAIGDWRLLFLQRDQLKEVTAADVNLAAERFLISSNRTSGVFIPTDEPKRAEIAPPGDISALVSDYRGSETIAVGEAFLATAENIQRSTRRVRVGEIDLGLLPKATRGQVVVADFQFLYGTAESMKGHVTALGLLPGLMMRGAGERDYQALRDELNRIETDLRLFGGAGFVRASIKTTREDLSAAIRLLGEIMQNPTLPVDELETLRKARLSNLERMKSDPQGLVFNELGRSLSPYPSDDVRYQPTMEEQIERISAVGIEEIRTLHDRFLGAGHLDATLVGDFAPDEVAALVEEIFADWKSAEPYERLEQQVLAVTAKDETIDTPDKQMAVVARGAVFEMRDDDPAYPALRFANFVFGQSPKSRLMNALRHEGGLSYGAGSMLNVDDEDPVGQFLAFAICAPQNAEEAQRVLQAEFDSLFSDGLSEQEIDEYRKGYLEQFKTQLANDSQVASQLLSDVRTGRDFRFREKVVMAAEELSYDDIRSALGRIADAAFVDLKGGDVAKFGGE